MRLSLIFLLLLSGIAAAEVVIAQSPEDRGLAIATEARRIDNGFIDSAAVLEMTLRNAHGESSVRLLRALTLESADGEKRLLHFDEPSDLKGTIMLVYTHKRQADDQWMYLPSMKRVKRIASNNKAGPFMGSEFAYEDLGSQEVEKYHYKYLRDEMCLDGDCFVIERYPVDADSGYARQVIWLDKTEYRLRKVEFYDRRNALLKTLTLARYERYLGKFWRAHEMSMENVQTGKSTMLRWSDYKFHVGLKDGDLHPQRLADAR
jgi:outer membrane lipoprotein-sorting protein